MTQQAVVDVSEYELWMIDETRGGKWPQGPHECTSPKELADLLNGRNSGRVRADGNYFVALKPDGKEFRPHR